jgi:hypothetical protein
MLTHGKIALGLVRYDARSTLGWDWLQRLALLLPSLKRRQPLRLLPPLLPPALFLLAAWRLPAAVD